ncbi:putative NAD(P)H dehydrogenase (quinone) [Helianthus debilis subsp. tardiflorus]
MATKPIIKIAAICGSLRKASYNAGLLRSAIELSGWIDGITIEYLDISSLPMLNTDLEVDGKCPPVVEAFRQKILQYDGFLFASPEYNYSITDYRILITDKIGSESSCLTVCFSFA